MGSDPRYSGRCKRESGISIHAPRMGSDLHSNYGGIARKRFQSTPPAWGATFTFSPEPLADPISIHAPRMGSDHSRAWAVRCVHISIHAPRMGSDHSRAWAVRCVHISIHAPRMGSDCTFDFIRHSRFDFNPRPPHGERLGEALTTNEYGYFNPRPPHGERLQLQARLNYIYTFQSTPPAWGATTYPQDCSAPLYDFNPRPPHGERRTFRALHHTHYNFNPRPPHGERQYSQSIQQ